MRATTRNDDSQWFAGAFNCLERSHCIPLLHERMLSCYVICSLHWICYVRMSVVPATHVLLYGVLEHDSVVDLKVQACKLKHSQVCFAIMSWCCTRGDILLHTVCHLSTALLILWILFGYPGLRLNNTYPGSSLSMLHSSITFSAVCLILSAQNDDPFWFFFYQDSALNIAFMLISYYDTQQYTRRNKM